MKTWYHISRSIEEKGLRSMRHEYFTSPAMATKQKRKDHAKKPFFKRKKVIVLLSILLLLIIFRLMLPWLVLRYVNKTLAEMDGYYGHVQDIDISLYRGAYQINDIYINKKDSASGKETDFFKAKNIDLSVEWGSLLHGSLVGELEFNQADLVFTKDKVELGDVKKDTSDFRTVLKKFMPLKVNRFEINDSKLRFTDKGSKPKVDVALSKLHVLALNLRNSYDSSSLLPASVSAQAQAYQGSLRLDMKLNPLAKAATFDLNAEVKNVNLASLNDFLKAYGKFDVNKGNFGLYTELATKNNRFTGYVKPIIKDLDVVGPEDRKDAFFQKIWETIVGGVGVIFKNQEKNQIATKIRLEGNFKDPDTNILDAIWEVLRNAFIQALMPSVDNQINIRTVDQKQEEDKRNLFQRIFGKKDKDKDKKNTDKPKDKQKK
jgi:hypothetical protein